MSKLKISVATTLDGVIDGFEWFVPEGGHDQASRDELARSRAMLVGRKSYEGFVGYWPAQEGPWADLINPMPKFVASRTLSEPLEWNAQLLEGELGDAVRRLKDELDGTCSCPAAESSRATCSGRASSTRWSSGCTRWSGVTGRGRSKARPCECASSGQSLSTPA
jgi:hypothetical protein